jgi:hypothetical protein
VPSFSGWMRDAGKVNPWKSDIEDDNRVSHFTERVINDKPAIITVYRNSIALAPQTVRIEQTRIQPDKDVGPAGREHNNNAVLIGYRGHATIADCDIQSGDLFTHDNIRYEVRLIFPETPGRVEAWLEIQE